MPSACNLKRCSSVSSNEEVVFGAPAVQMQRGGEKYCAFEAEWENCKMAATGTVCISEDGKCGTGVEVGAQIGRAHV